MCGKPLFRYHDVSKNIYVSKCASTKYVLDIKTRKFVLSKKPPCKSHNIYHGERPVFTEIKKVILNARPVEESIEQKLKRLFSFFKISGRNTVLQEIDIIVKYDLNRLPRKTYYFPSIGALRISHYESIEDYELRVFSKKIITVNYSENKETTDSNKYEDFVPDPEIESESDSNSESGNESNSESEDESESQHSDSEIESNSGLESGSDLGDFGASEGDLSDFDEPDDYKGD